MLVNESQAAERDCGCKRREAQDCDLWGCKSGAIETHLPPDGEQLNQRSRLNYRYCCFLPRIKLLVIFLNE